MSRHIILLGDSIFDNASYVPDGPCLKEQLQHSLSREDRVTLLALDGATTATVFEQLDQIPADATHLVLSVGGNDALRMGSFLLSQPAKDVRSALQQVAELAAEFKKEYRRLVSHLRAFRHELAICTIYDAVPGLGAAEVAGLCVFNDTITRTAFESCVTLIDLRTICTAASDYSSISPIEPSVAGGKKIVRAIADAFANDREFSRVIR